MLNGISLFWITVSFFTFASFCFTTNAKTLEADLDSPKSTSQQGIQHFFNQPVAHEVAFPGNPAHGRIDLEKVSIDFIQQAQERVVVTGYELNLPDFTEALIRAQERGVEVSVILDGEYLEEPSRLGKRTEKELLKEGGSIEEGREFFPDEGAFHRALEHFSNRREMAAAQAQRLENHGIPVYTNAEFRARHPHWPGIQHSKTLLRDPGHPNGAVIITSANWTRSGVHGDFDLNGRALSWGNHNSLTIFQSPEMATWLYQYTNQMEDGFFGNELKGEGKKAFRVGNTEVELWVSPLTRSIEETANLIRTVGTRSVHIAAFWITHPEIISAIRQNLETYSQFHVEVLMDWSTAKDRRSRLSDLKQMEYEFSSHRVRVSVFENSPAYPHSFGYRDKMHHKFILIQGEERHVVIDGSSNLTVSANERNTEIGFRLNSQTSFNQYRQRFTNGISTATETQAQQLRGPVPQGFERENRLAIKEALERGIITKSEMRELSLRRLNLIKPKVFRSILWHEHEALKQVSQERSGNDIILGTMLGGLQKSHFPDLPSLERLGLNRASAGWVRSWRDVLAGQIGSSAFWALADGNVHELRDLIHHVLSPENVATFNLMSMIHASESRAVHAALPRHYVSRFFLEHGAALAMAMWASNVLIQAWKESNLERALRANFTPEVLGETAFAGMSFAALRLPFTAYQGWKVTQTTGTVLRGLPWLRRIGLLVGAAETAAGPPGWAVAVAQSIIIFTLQEGLQRVVLPPIRTEVTKYQLTNAVNQLSYASIHPDLTSQNLPSAIKAFKESLLRHAHATFLRKYSEIFRKLSQKRLDHMDAWLLAEAMLKDSMFRKQVQESITAEHFLFHQSDTQKSFEALRMLNSVEEKISFSAPQNLAQEVLSCKTDFQDLPLLTVKVLNTPHPPSFAPSVHWKSKISHDLLMCQQRKRAEDIDFEIQDINQQFSDVIGWSETQQEQSNLRFERQRSQNRIPFPKTQYESTLFEAFVILENLQKTHIPWARELLIQALEETQLRYHSQMAVKEEFQRLAAEIASSPF